MRIAMFYHSLISDWNHGNAHFLRGIVTELQALGHDVQVFEPQDAWSVTNLVEEHGVAPLQAFRRAYPHLTSYRYRLRRLNLEKALQGVTLILVHEWNEPTLIQRLGRWRKNHPEARLLFHDTHHRAVTRPEEMVAFDLSACDGVLAFGNVIRDIYLQRDWTRCAWTWHEAADTRVFRPVRHDGMEGDLVWIGNWGDDERSRELRSYCFNPIRRLGLKARVYGVRYPPAARRLLQRNGIDYRGWLPNFAVSEVFGRFRLTVHVPRQPYARALPGIPTIRPFEAMACGIPLVSAPWDDVESLFRPGRDFLLARSPREMEEMIRGVLDDPAEAGAMARRAQQTIRRRHTCAHRARELLEICDELGLDTTASSAESIERKAV